MLNKVLESSKSDIRSTDGYNNWSKTTTNTKKQLVLGSLQHFTELYFKEVLLLAMSTSAPILSANFLH